MIDNPLYKPKAAQASSDLICTHRPPCSGCPRFGADGIAPASLWALEQLAAAQGAPSVAVVSGKKKGFRMRARLAIRGRIGSPKLGLFESGTHRVVHVPNCQVHHPLINRVAAVVRRALVETQTTCYSDKAHLGLARYLQVVVERQSNSAQVVLVANSESAEPLAACLDLIRERLGDDLHSLWFNANTGTGNAILGPVLQQWCGPSSVVERFCATAVHYPPGAFGQNNLEIGTRIIEHVRGLVPADAAVTEFYAGVGAIGLSLLDRTSRLTLNEISDASLQGLEMGLAALTPEQRAKVTVVAGPAGESAHAADDSQVVIVDPPRKGLDETLLERWMTAPPETLIYVSCGLESFLADAGRLLAEGKLRLTQLTAFNLLPFTEHVETVALFERA
jgi:23S rRNA (uracil1939-C5)-methyltransferase